MDIRDRLEAARERHDRERGRDRKSEDTKKKKKSGKGLMIAFALPFFCIGLWALYSISSDIGSWLSMKSWEPVQGQVLRGGYETHSGEDSDSYEAYGTFKYYYNGRWYESDRVMISDSGDNIGDYQQDLGNELRNLAGSGKSVEVYVNPDDPSEAIYDREIRWGMVGFKAIFLFVFGGFGLGLLIFTLRAKPTPDSDGPRFADKPWLANDDWQTADVKSSSKLTMYFAWGFAAIWNLISAPLPFLLYEEVMDKENYAALLGLLFPLVGIGLLVWAIRQTLEWRRFGQCPVRMDPFPGAIGGHVGGTIELKWPYDPSHKFVISLTNLYSYVSGSGDNRSRNERAKWQDSVVAHSEPGLYGTRLTFRFDVPDNLNESDAFRESSSYHLWRLNLSADLPGVDLDRSYEIPVYPTAEKSQNLSERAIESSRSQKADFDKTAITKIIRTRSGVNGTELFYPVGRNIGNFIGGLVFGGIFAGVGYFLVFIEGMPFFGGIFGLVGLLIMACSFYTVSNSLRISNDSVHLNCVRRVFGIPVKRVQLRRDGNIKFSKKSNMQSQQGGKHVMHYSIYATDSSGRKACVGEGFKGSSQAKAAIRYTAKVMGIDLPEEKKNDDDKKDDDIADYGFSTGRF